MRISVAEKNGFRDQIWRNRNWYRYMFPDPCYSLGLLARVFPDTNGLKIKYCQVLEQFLIISILDIECIQLFKKRFSQIVDIFWVNMFNAITTGNQMSFQIPRLWEKCVTRNTLESFEQCIDVVDVANVIVVAKKLDTFFILLNTSSTELTYQFSIHKINVIKKDSNTTFPPFLEYQSCEHLETLTGLLPHNFLGNVLKIFDVFSSSFSLPCKCRANALNKQRLSL